MKKQRKTFGTKAMALFLSLILVFTSIPAMSILAFAEEINSLAVDDSPRLELIFNKDWKFNLGDVSNAYSKAYSDSSWDAVDLPHDFSIIQDFTISGTEGESGSLPGGTGWYRKSFIMPAEYADRSVIINFDASYCETTVYVNGVEIGENLYGYNPFSFDLSEYLVCDGATANLIAVKVKNPIPTSRWYSGSGLIGDVTMTIVNDVHVSLYGTQVTTPDLASSNGTDGTTNVNVTLQNDGTSSSSVTVVAAIKDPSNSTIAQTATNVTLGSGVTQTASVSMDVTNPSLWSPDSPALYTMNVTVLDSAGEIIDEYDTAYGYSWSEWSESTGFSFNGENLKLQGVCMHHDQGALGGAQEYDAIYRQLSILKEMGVNSVRTSHNTFSRVYLDVCNELGIIVMEEFFDGWVTNKNGNSNSFGNHFNTSIASDNEILGGEGMKWYQFVITQTMKRDRNDPSIIVWDVGNELDDYNNTAIASDMKNIIDSLDERPMLWGNNSGGKQAIDSYMDLFGGNYHLSEYVSNYASFGLPFVGTETASAVGSRGVYRYTSSNYSQTGTSYAHNLNYASASDYQISAYDAARVGWGNTAADAWYYTIVNDWFSGEYVWTGFDYIGEPTPWNAYLNANYNYAYPNSTYFGIIDTAGFGKDSYYLYNAFWDKSETTLHLVPGTWNRSNLAVDSSGYVDVAIYSNAPYVELLYNGNVIGKAYGTTTTTAAGHQYTIYTESVTDNSLCKVGTLDGSNDHNMYPLFEVLYDASAEITVKAYESEGGAEITDTVGTNKVYANSAANIVVSAWNDDTTLTADGDSFNYIEITAVDSDGNFVNDYNGTVNITLSSNDGAGVIAGVDNGNAATTQKFQSSSALLSDTSAQIQMFNGRALVIVQSTENTGSINVTVDPTDLAAKSIGLTSVAETGDELTDEFEEVVDQTINMDNLDDDARYELLKDSVDALDVPKSDVTYELYTLGSGAVSYVPTGNYIISGVDTTGTTSTGVLNTTSAATGTLQTSGSDPDSSSQVWSFTRQSNGLYVISFTGENITNEFLNISADGPVITGEPQELEVTFTDGTVTIGDGTNYITYSASSANTAGVSATGTSLKLYTVDGTDVNRWGDIGLVEDGQYVIFGNSSETGNPGYVMTPNYVENSGATKTGFDRSSATPDGNVITTDTANEVTITKIEDSENLYTIQLSTGEYLNIDASVNMLVSASSTPVETIIVESPTSNRVVICTGMDENGVAKCLDIFSDSDAQMFCSWGQTLSGTNANERFELYRRAEPDSAADVSLYNALAMAMALNPNAYTDESYSGLLDAVQDGYDKYTNGTATDEEKNAATAAIDAAYALLEKSAISPTLKEDIANLDAPVSQEGGYFLYTASSGTPIPDGEYIIYAPEQNGSNYSVMTGTYVSYSSAATGFTKGTGTVTGNEITTASSNEWTITYNSSTGKYTIVNQSGQYLNISGTTNRIVSGSSSSVELSVTPLSDGTVNIHNGTYYLQNQDTDGSEMFSSWSNNGVNIHNHMTLYRKQEAVDTTDKQALYDAMQNANGADEEMYTDATYEALQRALQNGYNVYTNDAATADEITAATVAINQAYAALKYKNLKPILENQIAALAPPAGSEAQYGRYTATNVSAAIIPDGEYVISGHYNTTASSSGAWGVMTNTYVLDDGTWWDGMGFAASYSEPTVDSDTWLIERDTSTGYYRISRLNSNGVREYLYAYKDNTDDNAQMSGTTNTATEAIWWTAEINSDTYEVKFRSVYNSNYLITFMGDYAYSDNNVSSDVALYVSIYYDSNNKADTPMTLQRKENGKLVPWHAPIADGRYIVTQSNANDNQTSNISTNIMDITKTSRTGSFDDVDDVAISNNKITTDVDHELTFTLVDGTANQYYITNGAGQYLNIGTGNSGSSYNYQLSFTSTPTSLIVEADSYGNVYISREMGDTSNESDNIYLDHYVNDNIFSTWMSAKGGNQAMRLFSYEKMVSENNARQALYNKLHQAIAIEQGNYSDESYNNLLLAIKDGIDSYNNDTTDAEWTAAKEAIDAAIAALEIAKATFGATLYKYGYTPDADYSAGGYDFNEQSYAEMKEIIESTPELMEQIGQMVNSVSGQFTGTTEQQVAIESVVAEYAKIYTLAFSGHAVSSTGSMVNNRYQTFWNVWEKPGTKAAGESNNEGASVQGLFSTTLGADGLPTSHDAYATLPYINTSMSSDTQNNDNEVQGIHSNLTMSITKGGTSRTMTLTPLNNISVHIPDFFSKNVVAGTNETYSKYYWDVQFPFVEYTNNFGVNTYVYDSSDTERVFQASYDDATNTAQAQLTEIDVAGTGGVNGPNTKVNNKGAGFFPFNNRLDGSNADMSTTENAIYHFGMSFSTEFYVPSSGSYGDGNDIVFDFSGDDDVLVYIDDVLVLDNSGLHGARDASINFTDKSVTYQYIADVETGTVTNAYSEGITYTYGAENAGISAQNQAAIDYLNKVATDGQQHTFTFYYLERGSTDSNCRISFNIQKVSDYVKLIDQTYVVDFGIPVVFDVKENNITTTPEGYELPEYEYIGVAARIPSSANSGVMFTEPTSSEVTQFGSLSEMTYSGSFGTYLVNKNGTVKYTPGTMQFTNAGSMYLCAKVENDATYQEGQVYYSFEKVTIVPATSIYYEDDFEGNGITYTDGTIPTTEINTNNYGIWQDATATLPTGLVKGEIYQNADEAGASDANAYGYDQAYENCATYSGYSAKYVTVSAKNNPNEAYSGGSGSSWPKAEFTFAGTGFDLIGVTSKDTGAINLTVKNADGNTIKNHTVNTYYGYTYGQLYRAANGSETLTVTNTPLYFTADRSYTETPTYYDTDGTIVTENTGDLEPAYAMGWITEGAAEDDNALYQIPVMNVNGLDYGVYTVTVTPMYSSRMDIAKDGAYEFYIDAVRIYDPAGAGDTLTNATISYTYTQDKEANADYLELRNMLIGSNQLTDGTSAEGVVFIDGIENNDDVSKYTSGGPNNELYLLKDQAVAFEIWASAIPDDVQISAKAVGDAQPTMMISYATTAGAYTAEALISTSTDMYYSVDGLLRAESLGQLNWTPVTGADGNSYYTSGTVVIQNTTDGMISITNLKWTFPSAGIGYYENLENGGAEVVSEPLMLMSSYSTFEMARSSVRMVNADLEITEDDVTVENDTVTAGEEIVVNVSTSTDVETLVIRDEKGNVITPEAIESYVETIGNEDVKQWTVTLSEDAAGTYTYTITGAYENGYESDTPVVVTVTVDEVPVEEEEGELTFLEKLVGFFEKIVEFFKQLVEMLTGTKI